MAEPLIETLDTEALLADMAFDTNEPRQTLDARGVAAVVPSKPDRKVPILHDKVVYGWRHLIENAFCKLNAFRRLATRGACLPAGKAGPEGQDHHELHRHAPPRRQCDCLEMIVHRP